MHAQEKPQTQEKPSRIIRKPEVIRRTGLSDTSIWRRERDGKFPRRLPLGGGSVGWLESEIETWIESLLAARRQEQTDR